MINIVIATHSILSEAFVEAASMIAGKKATEGIICLCMTEGKSPEDFLTEIDKYLFGKDEEDEYLILTDLFGASPTNTSILGFRKKEYRVVTGLNLGMLLESLFSINTSSLDEVADNLVQLGKSGIKKIYIPDC